MKILTLNTHSLAEENATEKMQLFSGIIEQEQPEIMAFQEVNQTMAEPFINEKFVVISRSKALKGKCAGITMQLLWQMS